MEGVGLVGAGLNLMPQIGQVQYIQETENGQIIHYQLHDQYGQILQQDQGQTQVWTIPSCTKLFPPTFFSFNTFKNNLYIILPLGDRYYARRCATRGSISAYCYYNTTGTEIQFEN